MARRGLLPDQWRALPRAERVEVLAYEHQRAARLGRLLENVRAADPSPLAWLAEVMILMQAE
jgi:hypothetical protein